jgi:two-component system, cell cycle response regulator DivK
MRLHLLLVEDNDLNRDMITRRLERVGFEVSHAVDGVQAIELARTLLPDVILMDISIPLLDGYEATRRIKAYGTATSSIPIIALTAHALPEDERAARDAGADEFATKPVDFGALLEKIERVVAFPITPAATGTGARSQRVQY